MAINLFNENSSILHFNENLQICTLILRCNPFVWYVPLGSLSPYPIIVYSVANCRPYLSQFWEKCNFRYPKLTQFN